jgi:hypothetical protein
MYSRLTSATPPPSPTTLTFPPSPNPYRIVLMSATLHAKLLLDYFAATVGPAS